MVVPKSRIVDAGTVSKTAFNNSEIDMDVSGETDSLFERSSSSSPLSESVSNTDSDDSTDVSVRGPRSMQAAHQASRSRYRGKATSSQTVLNTYRPVGEISSERSANDASMKRTVHDLAYITPKKRFRRAYEQQEKCTRSIDGEKELERTNIPYATSGCKDHTIVVYECHCCLNEIAKRFGWPLNALLSTVSSTMIADESLPQDACMLSFNRVLPPDLEIGQRNNASLGCSQSNSAKEDRLKECVPSPGLLIDKVSTFKPPIDAHTVHIPRTPNNAHDLPLDLTQSLSNRREICHTVSSTHNPPNLFSIDKILSGSNGAQVSEVTECVNNPAHKLPPRRSLRRREIIARTNQTVENGEEIDKSHKNRGNVIEHREQKNKRHKSAQKRVFIAYQQTSDLPIALSHRSASPNTTPSSPVLTERREMANERERQRVKHLTGAFKELSSSVAAITSECLASSSSCDSGSGGAMRHTKVAVLRTAALYIGYLKHVVEQGVGESEHQMYEHMRRAIVDISSAKYKRNRDECDDVE